MSVLASVYFTSCEVKPAETVRDTDIVMCSGYWHCCVFRILTLLCVQNQPNYVTQNVRLPIWCVGSGFWTLKPVVTGQYWDITCFFQTCTGHVGSSGNASGMYSEGDGLESRAVYTVLPSTLTHIQALPCYKHRIRKNIFAELSQILRT